MLINRVFVPQKPQFPYYNEEFEIHLHGFDAESERAGGALFFSKLHVSQLCHFFGFVFFGSGRFWIYSDHL